MTFCAFSPDTVYWTEMRYEEQGRYVICSYNKVTNSHHEWTPKDFSARTSVHEYGGGNFFVYNGAVYFSNFSDQVLYMQRSPGDKPEPVTDTSRKWRYADGVISPKVYFGFPATFCIYTSNIFICSPGQKHPALRCDQWSHDMKNVISDHMVWETVCLDQIWLM